ncbi:hypothetical protein FHR92_002959 [Fontibacillus solani]|uniref:Uncharacterized protein n=1 Tax=Fontibacillus solani TaxID=1572857 RepID=A0A7W3XSF1_9BACL|nr:hypothetical protein [Fontibacillus solani]
MELKANIEYLQRHETLDMVYEEKIHHNEYTYYEWSYRT